MSLNLLDLAHDESRAGRLALLRKLTNAYFTGASTRSEAEATLFEEIVIRAAGQLEPSARAEVAGLFATEATAPHEIIIFFACDAIEVAQPVLQLSTVLTEQDLIEVALSFSEPHLVAIGRRRILSEAVSDVLVRCGSNTVLALVVGNPGAHLSLYAFSVLIRRAFEDERLQLELLCRSDRPTQLESEFRSSLNLSLAGLFREANETRRRRMAGDMLQRLIARATRERAPQRSGIQDLLRDVRHGTTDLGTELVILADEDRAIDFATVLTVLTGLDLSAMMTVLTGATTAPLFAVLRSLHLPWTVGEAALRLRARRRRRFYAPRPADRQAFEKMSDADIRQAFRQIAASERPKNLPQGLAS